MNFNKTTDYALRVLSSMAGDEERLWRVDDIFQKRAVPYRYLRKLMTSLANEGIIVSIQGKNGGYRLSKPSAQITLLEIVNIVDPEFVKCKCFFGFESCALQTSCVMHDKWVAIQNSVIATLSQTTLGEIKAGNKCNTT